MRGRTFLVVVSAVSFVWSMALNGSALAQTDPPVWGFRDEKNMSPDQGRNFGVASRNAACALLDAMMEGGYNDVWGDGATNPMSCFSTHPNWFLGLNGCGDAENNINSSRLNNGTVFDCRCLFSACAECGWTPDDGTYCVCPLAGGCLISVGPGPSGLPGCGVYGVNTCTTTLGPADYTPCDQGNGRMPVGRISFHFEHAPGTSGLPTLCGSVWDIAEGGKGFRYVQGYADSLGAIALEDAGDSVVVIDDPRIDTPTDLNLAAWIKFLSNFTSMRYSNLIRKVQGYGLRTCNASDCTEGGQVVGPVLEFSVWTPDPLTEHIIYATWNPVPLEWIHVVGVYDGEDGNNKMRLFVNGSSLPCTGAVNASCNSDGGATFGGNARLNDSADPLRFGGPGTSTSTETFLGVMDQVNVLFGVEPIQMICRDAGKDWQEASCVCGVGGSGFCGDGCCNGTEEVSTCPADCNPPDTDGDGIPDPLDGCTDSDGDGFGNPGFAANLCPPDNCLWLFNPTQQDADGDGLGDVCDNCLLAPNGDQVDGDLDGAGDGCDCAPTDPGAFAVPAEVTGLSILDGTLTWNSAAPEAGTGTVHQLLRGDLVSLPVGTGPSEICLEAGLAGTAAEDASIPPIGTGFWYLVRARNACGPGTYGLASDGQERSSSSCP